MSGTYVPASELRLTIAGNAGTRTLAASYVPGSEQPGSLAAVAGSYSGTTGFVAGSLQATFIIDAAGNFSGTNEVGCGLSGTLVPLATVRAFDWTLVATNDNCIFGTGPLSGVLYYDETLRQVHAFATFSDRHDEYFMIGTKP